MSSVKKILIVILGGWIVQKNNKWQTTTFENDTGGPETQGDRLRVLAAAYLYQHLVREGKRVEIFVSGGKGKLRDIPDVPNIADVIRSELIDLGVDATVIQTDIVSGSTIEQLKTIVSLKDNLSKIFVISNKYHLPRIIAMIHHTEALGPMRTVLGVSVQIVSAESILEKFAPDIWNAVIAAKIYHTPGMKKRLDAEQRGVTQLQEGTYGHE